MKIFHFFSLILTAAATIIYLPDGKRLRLNRRPRATKIHPVAPGVPALNLAGLQTMYLSRKEGRKLSSADFTFLVAPQLNSESGQLNVAFSLNDNQSWVYSQVATQAKGLRGYLPTRFAASKGTCMSKVFASGSLKMCDSIKETWSAGNGVHFTNNVFINHQSHNWREGLVGSIGGGRLSGFPSNFILTPDAGKMLAIVNPPLIMPTICREGAGLYSWLTGNSGVWQVQGNVGIASHGVAYSQIVLATTGYTEILPGEFEKFQAILGASGAALSHASGRRGFDVYDCRNKESWPSIRVRIGEFSTDIHPRDYVMVTNANTRDWWCHLDIMPSTTGYTRLGPAFMRKVVTHFATDRVGFCHTV